MAIDIHQLERVATYIQVAIVVLHVARIGHERVRADELAQVGTVVPGVVVIEMPNAILITSPPIEGKI
jgi:hypothetical protein